MRKYLSLIILIVICLFSCSSNKTQLTTEAKLKNADELYAKGKYSRAAVIYEEISFERKSAATAYATMKVADCYYNMHKFSEARLRYEQFISSFQTTKRLLMLISALENAFLKNHYLRITIKPKQLNASKHSKPL